MLEFHTSLVKIRTTLRSVHSMLSFHLPLGLQSGLKERGHLEELRVDERLLLMWVLHKNDERGQIRLIWLKKLKSSGLL